VIDISSSEVKREKEGGKRGKEAERERERKRCAS
jgi:hypothetical protein